MNYIIGWIVALARGLESWHPNSALIVCSLALLSFELWLSRKYLITRALDTFKHYIDLVNLVGSASITLPLALLISSENDVLSAIGLVVAAICGLFFLGIGVSASLIRYAYISKRFPWDLLTLYERSLNPNIAREYGTFVFLTIPLLLLSIFINTDLVAVALVVQLNSFYTRIRMTIPIAAFLTTNYERSADAWLALKKVSGERSIPGMALASNSTIPREVAVHQDLVRVKDSDDWLSAVATVIKYCKYIVFDTHSISDAVRKELSLVVGSAYLHKVFFIERQQMNPEILEIARIVERSLGQVRVLKLEEIVRLLEDERRSVMGKAANFRPTDAQIGAMRPTNDLRSNDGN